MLDLGGECKLTIKNHTEITDLGEPGKRRPPNRIIKDNRILQSVEAHSVAFCNIKVQSIASTPAVKKVYTALQRDTVLHGGYWQKELQVISERQLVACNRTDKVVNEYIKQ